MKFANAGILNILFLTLAIGIGCPTPVWAEVTVTPKAITINATRGESITRMIVLRSNENISTLKLIALDAYSADNSIVLTASAIQIPAPPIQVSANQLISFPATFNLQSAPSGEFTGEILLIDAAGNEKSIPVIVRVKAPWPWPLITLLLGIAIGMAVSAYSSQGKLSDEVTVNLENLRTQIEPDKAEARSFWSRADMHLTVARQARDAKQIPAAQTALDSARTAWNQWLRQRPNWLLQFRYYDRLQQRLEQEDLKNEPALYIQAIDRDLEETLQNAPDFSAPDELQQRLDGLSQQLNRYIRLKMQLEKLKDLIASLEGEQLYEWEDKAGDLAQRLHLLLPSQDTEVQALQDEMSTEIEMKASAGV